MFQRDVPEPREMFPPKMIGQTMFVSHAEKRKQQFQQKLLQDQQKEMRDHVKELNLMRQATGKVKTEVTETKMQLAAEQKKTASLKAELEQARSELAEERRTVAALTAAHEDQVTRLQDTRPGDLRQAVCIVTRELHQVRVESRHREDALTLALRAAEERARANDGKLGSLALRPDIRPDIIKRTLRVLIGDNVSSQEKKNARLVLEFLTTGVGKKSMTVTHQWERMQKGGAAAEGGEGGDEDGAAGGDAGGDETMEKDVKNGAEG